MAQSFDIREPLTKRLRGLLKEYPPGTTVLRELLQNADDAGARTVVPPPQKHSPPPTPVSGRSNGGQCYTVDTNSYACTSLVDPGLAAFQGPSLLVGNDSLFTERDFDSLRKLGDSNKLQERIATGKFGLGFSSVYGWTDSPQILTGSTFLAFSPHYAFEREEYKRSNGIRLNDIQKTGGYEDSLASFSTITAQEDGRHTNHDASEEEGGQFNGTIIRIPLRTKEQAEQSEIRSVSVSPGDILAEFRFFQNEAAESLLFLKNIEVIQFRQNATLLGSVRITNDVRTRRESIKSAIRKEKSYTASFEMHIHHEFHLNDVHINRKQRYQIHHKLVDITSLTDTPEFIQWTKNEGFFPWIALAAPLTPVSNPVTSGLFVSLPLPVFMPGNKIHIHGLFALSRDRRSLWTPADVQSSGKQTFETQWNSMLFKRVIPGAWVELLAGIAPEVGREVWGYFPVVKGRTALSVDESLLSDVLRIVVQGDEKVWYTLTGEVVPLSKGIVSFESLSKGFLDALASVQVPLIHELPSFLSEALKNDKWTFQHMSPESLRQHLRTHSACSRYEISTVHANTLLSYLLSDKNYRDLHDIPLFRCTDGKFHALVDPEQVNYNFTPIYLATPEEQGLFPLPDAIYLDVSSLPQSIQSQIVRDGNTIRAETNLAVFGVWEFQSFLAREGLHSSGLKCGKARDVKWAARVWKWIDSRSKSDFDNLRTILKGSKLIPLEGTDEFYELTLPCTKPLLLPSGQGGTLLLQMHERSGTKFPLVDERFKVSPSGFLAANKCVVEPRDLGALLSWITADVVYSLSGGLRNTFRRFIGTLVPKKESGITEAERRLMRGLPIFLTVTMEESLHFKSFPYGDELTGRSSFTTLDTSDTFVVISEIPTLPIIPRTVFLDGNIAYDQQLFSVLGYPPISVQAYLKTIVCPNISTQPSWLLDPLVKLIFDNGTLNEDWSTHLRDIPFITVQSRIAFAPSSTRLPPTQVIDCTSSIAQLYFDDEAVFPAGIYSSTGIYTQHLRMLGMKERIDVDVADQRIRAFATRTGDDQLYSKSEALLEFLSDRASGVPFQSEWRDILRLPAISKEGTKVVLGAGECRPESFRLLVKGVLGIVTVQIRDSLARELGWDDPLDPSIVAARIDTIAQDATTVESSLSPILEYIKTKIAGRLLGEYICSMRKYVKTEKYFPGSTDGLWSNKTIFFRDAQKYEPYLSVLPRSYVHDYHDILKFFDIAESPSPSDLLAILSKLPTDAPLEEKDIAVVLRILQHISRSDIDPSCLLVPDTNSHLHTLKEYTSTPTLFGHPDLSPEFTFKYQIPRIGDDTAFIKHLNGGTDVFEDYFQQESMTTRIRNTLKDYSLSTSFNEFVANAEDCGSATKLSWFLDSETTCFPTRDLCSPDLAAWQTPALYVYNDGVFTDADFKAFIQTGAGTKASDSGKIGRYGLGSLTMYHFTDIPSLISGDYFVIFDPQRRYLPVDEKGKRRAGMKIPISLMKASKKGHLIPFVGLGGYTLEMNRFEGTLFRLPLRTAAQVQSSPLIDKDNVLQFAELWTQLDVNYFEQARKSLALLANLHMIEFCIGTVEQGYDSAPIRRFHTRWTVGIEEGSFIQEIPDSCPDEMPVEKIKFSYFEVAHRSSQQSYMTVENWVVVSAFLSREAFEQTCSSREFPRKAFLSGEKNSIPAVAVAVELCPDPKPDGNFYSSLPLPAPTGLPIHCHGHFAMSSDRRSIRIDGDSGEWNRYLAEKCLPHLYFALLEQLCLTKTENYYAYWPGQTAADVISNSLLSSFWTDVRRSSRQLILSPDKKAFTFPQTIFDGRAIQPTNGVIDDPIARLVRVLRPQHLLIHEPTLNAGLIPEVPSPANSQLNVLNSAFVRKLLHQSEAPEALKTFDNQSIRRISDFILEEDVTFEQVVGCYICRLANGEFFRISCRRKKSKIAYLVDLNGFTLLNHLAKDRFIDPRSIGTRNWNLDGDRFNIGIFDGQSLDELICGTFPSATVHTYQPTEAAFIGNLMRYVINKKFVITFHQSRPTLPVQNSPSTFVSMKGCTVLAVMPPDIPKEMTKLCQSLKIHILEKTELADVIKMTNSWNRDERFLDCILRSQGNKFDNLNKINALLNQREMQTLRDFAIDVYDRISQSNAFAILQHIPVWQSACTTMFRSVRVKAHNSLVLRKGAFIEELTKSNIQERFICESHDAIEAVLRLGGRSLDAATYAFEYILPDYDPPPDKPVPVSAVKRLLDQILDHQGLDGNRRHLMRSRRLIPDSRELPRYGSDLYSRANRIFVECFKNDDSFFPHRIVEQLPLEAFGLQVNVNKLNLFVCLRRLEEAVKATPQWGLRSVWGRCNTVWTQWKEESEQLALENWTGEDITRISNIRCIPGYRTKPTPTYRATVMENQHKREIFTLREVYNPEFIPISWTQVTFAATKPPIHLKSIGFAPSVKTVVDHLVILTTQITERTKIENRHFFQDLVATYNFLAEPGAIDEASSVLQSRYADAKVWLNDESSLSNINAFVKSHARSSDKWISSLTWLKSSAILHGVPYDLPSRGLYSAKRSLEPYSTLLRACGSHVVKTIKAALETEAVEDHGQQMLRRLRNLREKQPILCDIQIQVEGKTHYAHRILLAAVSTYFNRLCSGEWKEKETGVLLLDRETYGSSDSVAFLLDWVYNGYVELDDGALKEEDLNEVQERLDHYLDCLELSNAWDMPEFRCHIENRILRFEGLFIRIENVSVILDLATRFEAEKLKAHCKEVIVANKELVDLVDNTRDE